MTKKFIFVDDDAKVLKGLQRMLRKYRKEWDMTFALSGAETLKIMETETFDVIVSDMRMPEMNGDELLNEVKKCSPQTVRIILSGHAEAEMIMKTVKAAHQFLAKPCDPELLKYTVSRVSALRGLLADERLLNVASQVESLPSLPSIYTRVMEVLRQPDYSIREVGEIISEDLGMTSKILQLVNSAFFGIPRRFSDVTEAVVFLGYDTIHALVLTFGIFSQFSSKKIAGLDIEKLSAHGLMTASVAKSIAKAETKEKEIIDDTFMAGLLHDVGKLILASGLTETYREVDKRLKQEKITRHAAEMDVFGITHAEIGAYLLGIWGLSDHIIESIAWHHDPESSPVKGFSPLAAVHAANVMVNRHSVVEPLDQVDLSKDDAGLDTDFLDRINCSNRIGTWQDLAVEVLRKAEANE